MYNYYRPPTELREGNVFSCVCPFRLSVHRWSYVTITHDALDLTVEGSPLPRPSPPLQTREYDGHHQRPVQTHSLEDPQPPTSTDIWRPPRQVWLASGQYASYWNASPEICSNLFTEARLVGKRGVCILLECLLVDK